MAGRTDKGVFSTRVGSTMSVRGVQNLVSHYRERDRRYNFVRRPLQRDRLQRPAFSAIQPLSGLSLDCDRPFLLKEGGV